MFTRRGLLKWAIAGAVATWTGCIGTPQPAAMPPVVPADSDTFWTMLWVRNVDEPDGNERRVLFKRTHDVTVSQMMKVIGSPETTITGVANYSNYIYKMSDVEDLITVDVVVDMSDPTRVVYHDGKGGLPWTMTRSPKSTGTKWAGG